MSIGFTGTRQGMTDAQKEVVRILLSPPCRRLHHGDCVGSDADAHDLAGPKVWIVTHPPSDERLRAFKMGVETREPKPYFERNRDIVDETTWLLATPAEMTEQDKGGTWYTIRYARSQGKPVVIVLPDGKIP